ncbi:hypothetical protein PAXINDRAFT_66021 [Paxillus involutus ATCC 200175]|nr:hypothetical protein PAXINDRAFT_66021 [Paxillus involutus ATCC 200175]
MRTASYTPSYTAPDKGTRVRFGATLSTTSSTSSLAKPRPYLPDLTPFPSSLRPHCLAVDRLRLWQPSGTAAQVTTVVSLNHTSAEDTLNHILQVIRASWADNTKAVYGTGLLVYHVYCDMNTILEPLRCPTSASLLSAFLSCCAGSYSGSAISNYAAGIRAWHLLHGHPWSINTEELKALIEGASRLALKSSKKPKREPFCTETLDLFLLHMHLQDPRDAAIVASKFDPVKHITHAQVMHAQDQNNLPVTVFHLPSTKCAPNGEDTQCTPLSIPSDAIKALLNHFKVNDPSPGDHLFAWKHPISGLRPLSKSEVTKCIASIALAHQLPNLKGHSLHIGGTLFYLLRGIPFDIVKTIDQWAGKSFTIYLHHHAFILAPYLQDSPETMDRIMCCTMPPVR